MFEDDEFYWVKDAGEWIVGRRWAEGFYICGRDYWIDERQFEQVKTVALVRPKLGDSTPTYFNFDAPTKTD